ncbi:MAG: glycosyltransferase, partial [Deltaproteobacteria bacterium]|nr:glycosyltransferase [Deltaproteobacteria bacterium]
RVVRPEQLHRAYQRLPASLRAAASGGSRAVSSDALATRDRNLRALAARAQLYAPSRWLADAAARQGFARPEVLPHGVDAPQLPRGDGPFLFLGTIAPHKGPALVIEAHRRAGLSRPLSVYGPPGPDAAYNAAVPSLGPVADPFPLLASARALVLGSTWPENAPLVVLEARAMGCPVVAPAIGGLPEIVTEGVDGWLYPAGDVDALAACLRRLERGPPLPVSRPPSFEDHADRLVVSLGAWLSRSKKPRPPSTAS